MDTYPSALIANIALASRYTSQPKSQCAVAFRANYSQPYVSSKYARHCESNSVVAVAADAGICCGQHIAGWNGIPLGIATDLGAQCRSVEAGNDQM